MLDEYYLRMTENSSNLKTFPQNYIKSRCLSVIEILNNINNKDNNEFYLINNATENIKNIIKEIKSSNNIKKLISRTNRLRKFNEPPIKKIRNRIQTQNEIFNVTSFNQSELTSIDKFFLVNNEKKYILTDIKKRIKDELKKLIIDKYFNLFNKDFLLTKTESIPMITKRTFSLDVKRNTNCSFINKGLSMEKKLHISNNERAQFNMNTKINYTISAGKYLDFATNSLFKNDSYTKSIDKYKRGNSVILPDLAQNKNNLKISFDKKTEIQNEKKPISNKKTILNKRNSKWLPGNTNTNSNFSSTKISNLYLNNIEISENEDEKIDSSSEEKTVICSKSQRSSFHSLEKVKEDKNFNNKFFENLEENNKNSNSPVKPNFNNIDVKNGTNNFFNQKLHLSSIEDNNVPNDNENLTSNYIGFPNNNIKARGKLSKTVYEINQIIKFNSIEVSELSSKKNKISGKIISSLQNGNYNASNLNNKINKNLMKYITNTNNKNNSNVTNLSISKSPINHDEKTKNKSKNVSTDNMNTSLVNGQKNTNAINKNYIFNKKRIKDENENLIENAHDTIEKDKNKIFNKNNFFKINSENDPLNNNGNNVTYRIADFYTNKLTDDRKKKLFQLLRSGEKIKKFNIEDWDKKENKSIINFNSSILKARRDSISIKNEKDRKQKFNNSNDRKSLDYTENNKVKSLFPDSPQRNSNKKHRDSIRKVLSDEIGQINEKLNKKEDPRKNIRSEVNCTINNKNIIKSSDVQGEFSTKNFNNFILREETKVYDNLRKYTHNFQNVFHKRSVSNVNDLRFVPRIKLRQVIYLDKK